MSVPSSAYLGATEVAPIAFIRDYWSLLKPRVMSLVIFTAICGVLLAPGTVHPYLAGVAILAIALGSGAAGALNMWYDRDIDRQMQRTKHRALPAGRVAPHNALAFGMILAGGSVLLLELAVGWVAASLLAFTIFFYVVIYTMWLKRWTAHNIVIGGLAGALPPVIGWASVTHSLAWEPLWMCALIFLWTPPHFWALCLVMQDDYQKVRVPMLPLTAGRAATQRQILLYSGALVALSGIGYGAGWYGPLYGLGAALAGALFLRYAWQLWAAGPQVGRKECMTLFGYSILYLFGIFSLMVVDRVFS